jgi:PAS domain S-box-containing protein
MPKTDTNTGCFSEADLLRHLLVNIPDRIYFKDLESRFIRINPAMAKKFGLRTPEDAIGLSDFEIHSEEHAKEALIEEQEIIRTGKPLIGKVQHVIFPDGKEGWSLATKMPLRDESGRMVGTFGITRDYTELKQAQDALQQSHEALKESYKELKQMEKNLQRSNRQLQNVNEQLRALNSELEAFSYSVSHDLLAPLRYIDGFSDLLGKHLAGNLDEKGKHYLKTINDSAKRMGVLVEDLLVFSRIGRSKMRHVSVEMNALLKEVIQQCEQEAPGRHIEWKCHPLPMVKGDLAMLRQVLWNLISNAVKYSRPRDPAMIETGADGAGGNETVFFIRDNGVGFDMAYAEKLFGVFQRLHRQSEFEGTGIGLANVQRIVLRHGGRVWAESKPDKGATFYFALPSGIN